MVSCCSEPYQVSHIAVNGAAIHRGSSLKNQVSPQYPPNIITATAIVGPSSLNVDGDECREERPSGQLMTSSEIDSMGVLTEP
jgi:hypothetical protein